MRPEIAAFTSELFYRGQLRSREDLANQRLVLPDGQAMQGLHLAPYNAQVARIRTALTEAGFDGARVGTVDKFQGQEAPVAIYSLASSSAADAPRGMEFLYALDRLNVATSRARAVTVVVASPALLTAECKRPEQMRQVNALVRFGEMGGEPHSSTGSGPNL